MHGRIKILVVGQTPPPHHGQAIMFERMLRGKYARVELCHVRMAFSDSIAEVGRFRFAKLLHLFAVVARIYYARLVHRATVLCYPPAGPNRTPLYRDLAILLSTRWLFRRTILYFHAGGVSQLYEQLSRPLQWLFRRALFNADAGIRISKGSPEDSRLLRARRDYIVPNGMEDEFERFAELSRGDSRAAQHGFVEKSSEPIYASNGGDSHSTSAASSAGATVCEPPAGEMPLQILYVGMLTESKGLLMLIEACATLAARGVPFQLSIVGQFTSADFEQLVHSRIAYLGLEANIQFLGVLKGQQKWEAFSQADVLCLPTFYEAETFGLVLVEAMSFGVPCVATQWRGIPEIVDNGVTGLLVEPHDADATADSLEKLHIDEALRKRLGQAGREKFLREFTVQRYWQRIEQVFVEIAEAE